MISKGCIVSFQLKIVYYSCHIRSMVHPPAAMVGPTYGHSREKMRDQPRSFITVALLGSFIVVMTLKTLLTFDFWLLIHKCETEGLILRII